MADTSRDYATLITALADNKTGAITEQTLRDLAASLRHDLERPERRPTSPNAEDNEFDSTLGSWVAINAPTSGSFVNGKLVVVKNLDATQQIRGYAYALPTPSGVWGYMTRAVLNPMDTSSMVFGLRRGGGTAPNVANVTTDQSYVMRVYHDGTTNTEKYTGTSVRNTSDETFAGQVRAGTPVWWRVESDGAGNVAYEMSFDGSAWTWFGGGNTRNFKSNTTYLGGTPDSLLLGVINAGSARPIAASFDFVRRYL